MSAFTPYTVCYYITTIKTVALDIALLISFLIRWKIIRAAAYW